MARSLIMLTFIGFILTAAASNAATQPFPAWENGLPTDDDFFPVGVWLQNPNRATQYQAIDVNLYVGLWQGPTEQQLTTLRDAGMPVIASQNDYARTLLAGEGDPSLLDPVVGWAQQDEPDNAQRQEDGSYGDPITPEEIQNRYDQMKSHDDTRPVYLNLGQGVAWDGWPGRGSRTNRPEDYPEYVKGTDIASFDIYPAATTRETQGELWRVGYGTARLRQWTADDKPVWAFIEASRIHGAGKATPDELRGMVWMALVNGATGIQYFVHEFDSNGNLVSDHALLNDTELRPAVAELNAQIHELAPLLNSASVTEGVTVESDSGDVPIAPVGWMLKRDGEAYHLFAVGQREHETSATFDLSGLGVDDTWTVEVVGEDRVIDIHDGAFTETFDGWAAHQYRIIPEPTTAAIIGGTLGLLAMRRSHRRQWPTNAR